MVNIFNIEGKGTPTIESLRKRITQFCNKISIMPHYSVIIYRLNFELLYDIKNRTGSN